MTSIGETRGARRTARHAARRRLVAVLGTLFGHRAARRQASRGDMPTRHADPGAAFGPEVARDAGLRRDHLDYARPAPLRTAAPARLHRIAERARAGLPPR